MLTAFITFGTNPFHRGQESPTRARACHPLRSRTLVSRYQGEVSFWYCSTWLLQALGISTVGFQERFPPTGRVPSSGPSSVLLPGLRNLSLLSTPTWDDDWIALS